MAAAIERPGQPKLRVGICTDPILGGIGEVLKWDRIRGIIEQYPTVDLFLVCVDRDGLAGRRVSLDRLEKEATQMLPPGRCLLAENAWQEIEVWILAGCKDLPGNWDWRAIRAEVDLKERYFEPYVAQRGLNFSPWEGRQLLAREAARDYQRICRFCPEDIEAMESRIQDWIEGYHG